MPACDNLQLELVLYEPEIPQNTGSIMRLSVNIGAKLHLIRPIGFSLSESKLKRAGLDYQERANITIHNSFEDFLATCKPEALYLATTKTSQRYSDINYPAKSFIMFGPESRGLPSNLLSQYKSNLITIPMQKSGRSLNLATAVAIIGYDIWRQYNFS